MTKDIKCESCNKKHTGQFGSGRFCNKSCAARFSTKNKRKEINKKVSKSLTGTGNPDVVKNCLQCESKLILKYNRRKQEFCNISCSAKYRNSDPNTRKKLSEIGKKRCESIEERIRLKNIGRKGGFGKKGYTSLGTRYESSIEEKCFNWLEESGIEFIPHMQIPNSSKVSDVYFPSINLWVEIDGINREKKKQFLSINYDRWKEKLKIYEREGLNILVVNCFDEFKEKLWRIAQW